MGLFARLRRLFESEQLPPEDREAYAQSSDLPSLVARLHDNVTRNEVMRRQIMQAMGRLEQSEAATVAAIKRGEVTGRGVKLALQTVNRLRKQLESLEKKAEIVDQNLNLNTNLINKIDQMQALELRGVEQDQVDRVALEFDENMDRYRHSVVGSEAVIEDSESVLPDEQRTELAALEKEILGEVKHFAKPGRNREAVSEQPAKAAPQKAPEKPAAKEQPLRTAPPVKQTTAPAVEVKVAAKQAAPEKTVAKAAPAAPKAAPKPAEKPKSQAEPLDDEDLGPPVSEAEMKATMDEADRLMAEIEALEAEMGKSAAKETE